jgi:hypothetical protein
MMPFRNFGGGVGPGPMPVGHGGSVGPVGVRPMQGGGVGGPPPDHMAPLQGGIPPQVNRNQLSPALSHQRPFSMIGNPGMRAQTQLPSF